MTSRNVLLRSQTTLPAKQAHRLGGVDEPAFRGLRTLEHRLLAEAAAEFGEKGFHDSSIVSITIRAGVALGSFYTYFESKEALFKALVTAESGWNPSAGSPVGARGLTQLMPATAKTLVPKYGTDNIRQGVGYLKDMHDQIGRAHV